MGRPPTSGYCRTCRRRRVKCDRLRPACEKCLRSGHPCGGYELPLRMQHFTATVDPSGAQQLSRISNTTKTTLPPPTMVQELTLTAFREQIAFSHLLSNYRWGPFWKPVLRVSLDGATQSDVVKADYTGSLATALGFMGARVNEPTMLAEGYELNGRVIRALQSALLTKSKIDLANWAVTITILSLYQFAVDQEVNIPHYYGMARIVEWCGPECFQHEPMLTNLRHMRALHACKCFNKDEGTFFAQERWKILPWLHHPKTSHDLLMDICVDIPGLTFSVASSAKTLSTEQKTASSAAIHEMLSKLYDWRRVWESNNRHAAMEVFTPLKENIICSPWVQMLLSRPLLLNTAQQAAEMLIYNSALVQLMNLQDFLQTGNRFPEALPTIINQAILRGPDQPLYMPEDIKHRWQPSIEGLRIMRLVKNIFTSSEDSVLISLSPIGIIYNSLLATEGMGRFFLSLITVPDDYARTDEELSIFRLWKSSEHMYTFR
ncbi:Putative zn(2)Cys(6) fungal-type DNA-binding domain-containing protein [Colletotrichum destructivum]|uniref:Zn(2)Cys(6) fungal-type DNA-binding domain-containing protein n=1 Tax=Colletotrichum destructivum TaxID=34406 RepID=A0AAX4IL88_9PEZI|nr:Putative zn(2)Cys(6) fungal-type DNA-binding domain-containing protein [Colletotrichum destructivum]